MQKRDKKQAILDSALILFVERGVHASSTASIAKQAGVATGTLFHHFPTKTLLLNHLYLSIKQAFSDALTQALADKTKPTTSIKEDAEYLWQHALDWGLSHPREQQFFLQYSLSSEIDIEVRDQAMNTVFYFLINLIQKGQQQKCIAAFPIELMLQNCHGQYLAAIRYFNDNPDFGNEPYHRNASFELFWRSMQAQ